MRSFCLVLLVGLASCGGGGGGGGGDSGTPAAPPVLGLVPVITGLDQPVFLASPPGDSRLFIVERPGRIRLFKNGALVAAPVLDISARVSTSGERGLFSVAFDPGFPANGFLYVNFTDPSGDVAVERFRIPPATPDVADPAALRILTVPHRDFDNHNGGRVAFGPDGFLYFSIGDGGGGGDPSGNGQDLDSLLGKLLRIDVSHASGAQPYVIPPGNPFVAQPGRRPEIWAYGLRNPWRFAFDAATNLLYIGDVGQAQREEVDVAPVNAAGLNYGWNRMEGTLCFASSPCSASGLALPVVEYAHDAGCSIIGGFVYRGNAIPALGGHYFYSDLCAGGLRSFRYDGTAAVEQATWSIPDVGSIYSFGEDAAGELYMLATSNIVYRIIQQ
jgi:glucose/arabinose dehydrogenase